MTDPGRLRVGILATHPVQYYVPWYRRLAERVDLHVFYAHGQTPDGQAAAGFGVPFDWDLPLLEGYRHEFLENRARQPNVSRFWGCHTPDIGRRIRAGGFDAFIVHGWGVRSYWQAMVACWRTGTPVLVRGDSQLPTARPVLWRALKVPIYRSFVPRFDGYLVVGERARAYLRRYGAPETRMFFAPHAVDNDFFERRSAALRPQRVAIREQWGLPANATVFLFAGKLVPRKRVDDFVQAVHRASTGQPRVWGLVAGDGPLRGTLESEVARRGWPVRFAGFLNQTEMPRAYAASDALVLPSDSSETWGLVVNEAMASGLPAVVSDAVGCGPDLVLSEETGAVFPCGEVGRMSSVLGTLADTPLRLAEMGLRARKRISLYSLDGAVDGAVAAIASIERRRPARLVDRTGVDEGKERHHPVTERQSL
jgi:glycosyltransferase involved in cell wall biosynthesis